MVFEAAALFPECESYIRNAQQRIRTKSWMKIHNHGPLIDLGRPLPKPGVEKVVMKPGCVDPATPIAPWVKVLMQFAHIRQPAFVGVTIPRKKRQAVIDEAVQSSRTVLDHVLSGSVDAIPTTRPVYVRQVAAHRSKHVRKPTASSRDADVNRGTAAEDVGDGGAGTAADARRRRRPPTWLKEADIVLEGAAKRFRSEDSDEGPGSTAAGGKAVKSEGVGDVGEARNKQQAHGDVSHEAADDKVERQKRR